MKKILISKYGRSYYKGVSLDSVSKTVPDQSLSVEEILRRFTTGTLLEGEINRGHEYGSDILPDEDLDNLDPRYDPDYDLVDAYEEVQSGQSLRASLKNISKIETPKDPDEDAAPSKPEVSSKSVSKAERTE